jgi:hypothetical protein
MFKPLLAALPLFAAALVVTPRARQLLAGRLSSGHWGSCAATDSGALSCWGFFARTGGPTGDFAINITSIVNITTMAPARLVGVGGYGLCVLRASPAACTCESTGHYPFSCSLSAAATASAVAIVHGQDPWMCALDASGTAACFGGGNFYTPPKIPSAGGPWVELAAGWYHACARSPSGAVACWGGAGASGEQNVPPRLNATTISTRDPYTCVLAGGVPQCWGGTWCPSQPVLPDLAGFNAVAIAAGGGYSSSGGGSSGGGSACRGCALNASGFLRCWASSPAAAAVPPHLQGDVAAVELGGTYSSCVVRASTAGVECWAFSAPPAGSAMAQPRVNHTLEVPPAAAAGAFCSTLAAALSDWTPPAVCAPPSLSATLSPTATPSSSGTPSPTASGGPSPPATDSPSPSGTAGAPPSVSATPSATTTGSPSGGGGGAASGGATPSASPSATRSATETAPPPGSGTQTGSPGAPPSAAPTPGSSGSDSGSGSPSPSPAPPGGAAAALPAGAVAGAAAGGSIGALALLCLLLFFFLRRPRARAPLGKGALQSAVSWRPGGGGGGGGAPLALPPQAAAAELVTVASPNPLAAAGLRAGGGGGGDAQPPPPLPQQPAELPPGWERCGPDEDGDEWYQHRETGETRWDPPPALPALPAGWRMVSDGADTWYTHADGRTAWEVPVSA